MRRRVYWKYGVLRRGTFILTLTLTEIQRTMATRLSFIVGRFLVANTVLTPQTITSLRLNSLVTAHLSKNQLQHPLQHSAHMSGISWTIRQGLPRQPWTPRNLPLPQLRHRHHQEHAIHGDLDRPLLHLPRHPQARRHRPHLFLPRPLLLLQRRSRRSLEVLDVVRRGRGQLEAGMRGRRVEVEDSDG